MKPFMYAIDSGAGTPEMSEACVAEDPDCLQESVDDHNAADPEAPQKQKVVAVFSEDQVKELEAKLGAAVHLLRRWLIFANRRGMGAKNTLAFLDRVTKGP